MSAFTKGQAVNTVYGVGVIQEKRASDYVVLLKNWALAQVSLDRNNAKI